MHMYFANLSSRCSAFPQTKSLLCKGAGNQKVCLKKRGRALVSCLVSLSVRTGGLHNLNSYFEL